MLTNTSPGTSPNVETRAEDPTARGDRVVLKIGTSSLVTEGRLDQAKLDRLCDTVHRGVAAGLSPVLVTSGAIAIGRTRHPALASAGPVGQQVAAALGQSRLYAAIQAAFADRGLQTGQLLLTPFDLVDAARSGGVRDTLATMLALGMIPVVNENDALGVRNNDVLAALLGGFLQADLLLLLTNVPGLYDSNPLLAEDARHIGDVAALTPELEELAGGSVGDGGTGGMRMKLGACWIATFCGVRTVIADTTDPEVLVAAHRNRPIGTVFRPRAVTGATPTIGTLWRAFRTPPAGSLRCTPDGLAAVERGETLRRQHIAAELGAVEPGDTADICDTDGRPVARGTVQAAIDPTDPIVASGDYVRIVEDQPCR
ncbi:glutamate 5-kinase [Solihabitans fulvus]|uniref:Glutamate 5-kinase n=1 Tax=Solihabitans fulvus TaxID=1892852 RepID=A0A5B2XDU3_9PSEU|nr:glutamate 5-kinase [Solihabitans fulvus]KAA2261396.1 glutamate 5-kinase [Solihabitans fulvus]